MVLADLTHTVPAAQLTEACILARGVDLLDHEHGLMPLEGVVHSDPDRVVRMGRYWGSAIRCTCGHSYDGGSVLAPFCVHAAAVVARWLADREPDPQAAITEVHDDAVPFAELERARDALAARAWERDPGDELSINAYVDEGLASIGLAPEAYDLHGWLLRHATPTQVERCLRERVASWLGEDGEADLPPDSMHAAVQVSDLLQGGIRSDSAASFDAALLAVTRIRSGLDQWSRHDRAFGVAIDLASRLVPGAARPGSGQPERFIRTVIGLEEKHPSLQIPIMPLVIEHWDRRLCELAASEVERRIEALLDLIDVDLASHEGSGPVRRDTAAPFLLDIDPMGDGILVDQRFSDIGRSPADLVHARLDRLQRLAADLALRMGDVDALEQALRRWSGATFAEFFHRTRRWSSRAQLAVTRVAVGRGAVDWSVDRQPLLAEVRDDRHSYGSSEYASDVIEIHERAHTQERLRVLGVHDVAVALGKSGLRADAQRFLLDQFGRDPDPRHVPAFVHCWEEANLPADPLDAARSILRGERADPPG